MSELLVKRLIYIDVADMNTMNISQYRRQKGRQQGECDHSKVINSLRSPTPSVFSTL